MSTDWIKNELNCMCLEEAINDGKYSDVRNLCSQNGFNPEETLELVALAQIQWLQYRGNFTEEGIAVWNSQEIRNYWTLDTSQEALKPYRGTLKLDTQQESLIKLMHAMKETIGYNVEISDSQRYSPGRRAAIDLFLSEPMENAIQRNIKDSKVSDKLARLIGSCYHCISVTSAMDIIPLTDFRSYVKKIEKWKDHLIQSVQENELHFYGFGSFDSTIQCLGITTREDYDRLREVVETTINITKQVHGGVDKVSKQVGDWISYIPDHETKLYIHNELVTFHGLNEKILDANTTPTEEFLEKRIERPIQQYMDYGSREWLDELVERVQTEGNRNRVAQAMIWQLQRAKDKYDIERVSDMIQYGSELYCEKIVRDGVKTIALKAFKDRDIKKLRILTPLIQSVYENDIPDELKALAAPQK